MKSHPVLIACLLLLVLPLPAEETLLPRHVQVAAAGVATRVVGSPEPPPLCTVEKAYPDFPIERLITFRFEPGTGRIFYVDQIQGAKNTRLRRFDPATGLANTLLEPDEFIYGLEFHPRYQENGWLYLGTNGPVSAERDQHRALILRETVSRDAGGTIDPAQALEIVTWPSYGHNGTAIAFGSDGMMYVTSGDGTSDSDTDVNGQRLDVLMAKVLRLDVDHPSPGKPYAVPPDNPFVGKPGVRPETYAYGLRNPWRATWDPYLNRLWVGQNGQDRLEQAYLITAGANYGWSVYEGSRVFYPERKLGPNPVSPPTVEHGHHEARSLTGGVVCTSDNLPGLKGAYIYGDYTTGKIWAAKHDGNRLLWDREIADTSLGITDFQMDPQGNVLVANYQGTADGGIHRLIPSPAPDPGAPDFPRRLSETGIFEDVASQQVKPGVLPYEVILPQWADGASEQCWLALPSSEPTIGFTPRRGWNFPDGTVALQTLALGEGADRRPVETRLLVRQAGEWSAYSYAWNDTGTDADLVPSAGRDGTIGGRPWRFESRASCMVCHSRAANFVLGLQTCQMNRTHDYGEGFAANQLDVMNRLGWFRKPGSAPGAASLMTKPPSEQDRLVEPVDERADIPSRARSYLHAACSHCHVESGGGNAQMDLRHFVELQKSGIRNAVPVHGPLQLGPDARIVAPNDPARSVLFHRVISGGPERMPPQGATTPDPRGTGVLMRWIMELAREP